MKTKTYFLAFAALLLTTFTFAQGEKKRLDDFSVGYHLNQYQNDFGFGINVTSPYIRNSLAVRLEGNLQWLQNTHAGSPTSTWDEYANIRLGFVGKNEIIPGRITVYGEGGFILIVPNSAFSGKQAVPGGYGVFGFEFHETSFMGQFVELGGVGAGATAEKSAGQPIYSNGFLISTGIRFYL